MTFYKDIFEPAQSVVRRHREWYFRESNKYPLHPAVINLLKYRRPKDWHLLLLEHPHRSTTDTTRLAYTRDERSGEADRQVVTSIGKYLMRHFDVPDHTIRDLVAFYTMADDNIKILDKVTDIIDAVQRGPYSCMCWSSRDLVECRDGVERHPYAVYDPAYGWRMAVRIAPDGDIVGRALLNTDPNGDGYWVRSYKKNTNTGGGYSYADEKIEAWLKEQGYEHRSEWHDGAQLAYYETRSDFLVPYIDGDTQRVTLTYKGALCIDDDGEYECNNTDGAPERGGRCTCPDCGERCDEDDMHSTGYDGDHMVCESCLYDDYTCVTGRRGDEYYVPNDDAIEADGNWYDTNYLDTNNIVELSNGDYTHSDNAVRCEDDDEWYHVDDPDVIFCEYDDMYHLRDNCVETVDEGWVHQDDAWQCEGSSNWYSDNVDYVLVDYCKYHPDHTPEQEELFEETDKE